MSGRWVRVVPEVARHLPTPEEELATRVRHAKLLLEEGDEAQMIAYLLGRPTAEVRRILGEPE